MKKLATVLLSATALMLSAQAANAEMRWPNWYIGLNGGIDFVGEEDFSGNPAVNSFDQDSGWNYGASIGYRPRVETGEWSNMRLELAWQHQRADIDTVTTPGGKVSGVGSVRANAAMLNVFYDAAISLMEWRPYVGAGVGFADLQLKNASTTFSTADDSDTVFAWNLMAGIGYVPSWLPYTEWTLGYRYFATSDATYTFSTGGSFDMEYDSHNLEAGVKFLF